MRVRNTMLMLIVWTRIISWHCAMIDPFMWFDFRITNRQLYQENGLVIGSWKSPTKSKFALYIKLFNHCISLTVDMPFIYTISCIAKQYTVHILSIYHNISLIFRVSKENTIKLSPILVDTLSYATLSYQYAINIYETFTHASHIYRYHAVNIGSFDTVTAGFAFAILLRLLWKMVLWDKFACLPQPEKFAVY